MKSKRTNEPNYRVNNSFLESKHSPKLIDIVKLLNIREYKDNKSLVKECDKAATIMNVAEGVKYFTSNSVKAIIAGWLCDDLIINHPNQYGQKGSWSHPRLQAELSLIRKDIGIVNYKTRK
jgi:hypothetical protein